ncbi:lytic transglycosylase, partial [Acinetobacter guillouiae]
DRWPYWWARASEPRKAAQSKRTAKDIYQRLAMSGEDYHNLLAKDHLGQKYNDSPAREQPSTDDQKRLNSDIHFRRAFTLRNINAPATYTNREWN